MAEIAKEAAWLKSPLVHRTDRLKPMCHLMVEPYQGRRRSIRVYRTRYLIGSDAECDIRVDDPFVSPRHAELLLADGEDGYEVLDLNSRNGVYLNGVKVRQAPLTGRGILRVGRSALVWQEPCGEEEVGDDWVVADPFMKETVNRLRQIARSNLPVLLLGETGTGKELLARLLHTSSPRRGEACVVVNGALTGGPLAESELFGHRKGAFTGAEHSRIGALRSANGGTLFLDEVADIPLYTQVKLLRALEMGEVKALGADQSEKVDFRMVSATSQNMDAKLQEGQFRLDLYYRIAGFVVHVPPLRERPLDILAITQKILGGAGLELDEESRGKLLSYPWPGNVRELRSCLGRAAVMAHGDRSGRVLSHHLVGIDGERKVESAASVGKTLAEIERDGIWDALVRNGWCRGISAAQLGIARSTLFEKMRRYGITDHASI